MTPKGKQILALVMIAVAAPMGIFGDFMLRAAAGMLVMTAMFLSLRRFL